MTITKSQEGSALTIALEGRLDTLSAPTLESELKSCLEGVTELTFDFAKLQYVSSAGVRVLIRAHHMMYGKGSVRIVNANEMVREVFDLTGVSEVLTVE